MKVPVTTPTSSGVIARPRIVSVDHFWGYPFSSQTFTNFCIFLFSISQTWFFEVFDTQTKTFFAYYLMVCSEQVNYTIISGWLSLDLTLLQFCSRQKKTGMTSFFLIRKPSLFWRQPCQTLWRSSNCISTAWESETKINSNWLWN